jgi:hypothetical protein
MSAPDDRPTSKLIVPGEEPLPEDRPRLIVGPSADAPATKADEPARTGSTRIVLPPGAASADEDLPEFPRLRPLLLIPISDGQREVVLVQDPMGVVPGQPLLAVESLGLLQLFDGATSLTDITAALMRESKDLRVANMVRDFVSKVDHLLMLDSPRFQRVWREIRDAYHPLEIRQAAFDGRSYPADRESLLKFLEAHYAAASESQSAVAGSPAAEPRGRVGAPRALLAPHLDPRRSGKAMAMAYRELDPGLADREPLRVIVFGTGHAMFGDWFALTSKHFETPLGRLECDRRFVDALARRVGSAAFEAEIAHRDEHSIEFQAVYLKHRFGDRPVRMVPILCGGFHGLLDEGKHPREVPEIEVWIAALRDTVRELGGSTVYVAGVDFSHVGPRFGDPAVDERTHTEVEAKDRACLEAARAGDPNAWFAAIAEHDDSTRICGLSPTYAMLRCAEPGTGRLLHYDRSDEPDHSFVTIASMIWD